MTQAQMIKYGIWLALLILAIFFGFAANRVLTITRAMSDEPMPHFDGQCQKITGIIGGEDVTVDKDGIAWVSAYDRRAVLQGKNIRGRIAVLDLKQKNPVLRDVTPRSPADFRPHGINLFTAKDGRRFLFAVNHLSDGGSSIERFEITASGQLRHNFHYRSPAISSPNDLVAVGPKQFYVTNDLGSDQGSAWTTIEVLFGMAWGSLAFYDGKKASVIIDGLAFPNGITVSADGRKIYMSEISRHHVIVYDRDPQTNALTQSKTIYIGSAMDNLEWDENGDLWTAAHPDFLAFGAHIEDNNVKAPTQVFRIKPQSGKVEEIYYNDGTELSSAATAAAYKNRLVLGPVFDDHLLLCDRR